MEEETSSSVSLRTNSSEPLNGHGHHGDNYEESHDANHAPEVCHKDAKKHNLDLTAIIKSMVSQSVVDAALAASPPIGNTMEQNAASIELNQDYQEVAADIGTSLVEASAVTEDVQDEVVNQALSTESPIQIQDEEAGEKCHDFSAASQTEQETAEVATQYDEQPEIDNEVAAGERFNEQDEKLPEAEAFIHEERNEAVGCDQLESAVREPDVTRETLQSEAVSEASETEQPEPVPSESEEPIKAAQIIADSVATAEPAIQTTIEDFRPQIVESSNTNSREATPKRDMSNEATPQEDHPVDGQINLQPPFVSMVAHIVTATEAFIHEEQNEAVELDAMESAAQEPNATKDSLQSEAVSEETEQAKEREVDQPATEQIQPEPVPVDSEVEEEPVQADQSEKIIADTVVADKPAVLTTVEDIQPQIVESTDSESREATPKRDLSNEAMPQEDHPVDGQINLQPPFVSMVAHIVTGVKSTQESQCMPPSFCNEESLFNSMVAHSVAPSKQATEEDTLEPNKSTPDESNKDDISKETDDGHSIESRDKNEAENSDIQIVEQVDENEEANAIEAITQEESQTLGQSSTQLEEGLIELLHNEGKSAPEESPAEREANLGEEISTENIEEQITVEDEKKLGEGQEAEVQLAPTSQEDLEGHATTCVEAMSRSIDTDDSNVQQQKLVIGVDNDNCTTITTTENSTTIISVVTTSTEANSSEPTVTSNCDAAAITEAESTASNQVTVVGSSSPQPQDSPKFVTRVDIQSEERLEESSEPPKPPARTKSKSEGNTATAATSDNNDANRGGLIAHQSSVQPAQAGGIIGYIRSFFSCVASKN